MSKASSQEDRLIRIVEGSKDGLWDWDLQSNEVFFNQQSYVLLDIPQKETAPTFYDLLERLLPEDRLPTQIAMTELIEEGIPYQVEHHIVLPDGSVRTCLCRGLVTEQDSRGQAAKISGTITDITHLKQVERSLKETQKRLDRVITGSDEGFWEWNVQEDTVYWSDRLFELLGIPKVEGPLSCQFFKSFILEEDRPRINAALDKTLHQGVPFLEEFRMRHASGNYLYLYSRAKPYYNGNGQVSQVSGMIANITRQKEQERLLMESEERFRNLADSSPAMIWMTNEQAEITYANTAYEKFFGGKDVLGLNWQHHIHPDDLAGVQASLDDFLTSPSPGEHELRIVQADGSYRWLYTMRAPRWDSEGKFLGYMGTGVDITKRKVAEAALKDYSLKLEKSNQELDQFVLIASHDLQEPLRKIALFGGFLKEAAGDRLPSECYDYLNRLQNAVTRMQSLIDSLLVLSRITRKARPSMPTDMALVMQTALAEVEKERKEVQGTIIVGHTITIDIDENQLLQVMVNLLDNALKFHRPGLPPVIHVDMRAIDDQDCEIIVSDNGIGFDEKYRDRIFKIFERLHGRGEYSGSGVGLAIVQKIVERHHGSVTAYSQPGEGSTFIVRLPIHAPKNHTIQSSATEVSQLPNPEAPLNPEAP